MFYVLIIILDGFSNVKPISLTETLFSVFFKLNYFTFTCNDIVNNISKIITTLILNRFK